MATCFSNANDTFQAKNDALFSWLQQRCGATVSNKIQIDDYRGIGAGRGVVALQNIDEDEELFCIPQSCILSTKTSDLRQLRPRILDGLDSWNSLILVMIYEDGKEMTSKWWPYLNVLPKDFDTLIYWSPSELAELQGSSVVEKIGRDDADQKFKATLLPLVKEFHDVFGAHAKAFGSSGAQSLLLALAHRMATLIMAYGFDLELNLDPEEYEDEHVVLEGDVESQSDLELEKCMVPLADMLNADGHLNNAHLVQYETSVIMTALKRIPKGQQIFNDLGQLPRSDLLRRYGYVTERYKQWDVVEISIEYVTKAVAKHISLGNEEIHERLQLAARWGALEDAYDLRRPSKGASFEFDEDLVLTINALLLGIAGYRRTMTAAELPKRRPPPMTKDVCLVLKDIINQRLNTYGTRIAEDLKISQNSTLQRRNRMAIEVRLGEKEILATAAHEVDQRLTALEDAGIRKTRSERTKRMRLRS